MAGLKSTTMCDQVDESIVRSLIAMLDESSAVAKAFRMARDWCHSYGSLMTVNKKVYATFKEVCFAYGLLNDDKEWTQAITEASFWALGSQLRDLFVTILLFCDVSKPLQLWEENWTFLSEDILHHKRKVFRYPELELTKPLQLWEENWMILSEDILHHKRKVFKYPELELTEEQIKNYCLVEIQQLLNRNGRSLKDFPDLSQPNPTLLTNLDNRLIREALNFDSKQSKIEHDQLHSLLNPEQRLIYEQEQLYR
ncbi:hypothetical protein CTI12_AA538510 [Artemisia annua]|uniref:Uncharacterized protein n=1 Tax=Artemisia annua TaxID=35608 RepID=A0A2U1L1N0_ARTAN|nr:hypothetical protein CTI12_AA538510 [Artemisia annua]